MKGRHGDGKGGNKCRAGANKRAAVWILLLCLLAGCGEKGKTQEPPMPAPSGQDGGAFMTEDAADGDDVGMGTPTLEAWHGSAGTPSTGEWQDGVGAPIPEAWHGSAGTPSTGEWQDNMGTPSEEGQPGTTKEPPGDAGPDAEGISPAHPGIPGSTVPGGVSAPEVPSDGFLIVQDTLVRYNGTAETVIVPEGVRVIGPKAFRGNMALTALVLPEGVAAIDEEAFGNCRKLEQVSLPVSLKTIGNRAFADCIALKTIGLEHVAELGTQAFSKCSALTDAELSGLKRLGTAAFSGSGLERVAGLAGLEEAGGNAFAATQFWEGYWEAYGQELFVCGEILLFGRGCGERLEIPQGIRLIAPDAFSGETALSQVVVPGSVVEIGAYAFEGCPLSAVYMPKQDVRIGRYAFGREIGGLMVFPYSDGQVQEYDADFLIAGTTLLAYRGEETGVTIPDGVRVIGEDAFETRPDIVKVSLPEGTVKIGARAFFGCSLLEEVSMPPSLALVGYGAFGLCSSLAKINLEYVEEIEEEAFSGCKGLKEVELSAARTLGSQAFAGSGVRRVGGLKPSASVGEGIFLDTPLFSENPMWIVGNTLFDGRRCEGDIVIPEGVEVIAERAFYGTGITSVVCPETLTEIGEEAFCGCAGLKKVRMGDRVVLLGERAFSGDVELEDLRLSAGLAEIPYSAFMECGRLRILTIPEGCVPKGLIFSSAHSSGRGGARLVTVPPTKSVPAFLKDSAFAGDRIYTTEVPEGSDWEEEAERFGFRLQRLELAAERQVLKVGGQCRLIFNSGAKADWHSENEEIVSVDADGMLRGRAVGQADVVAVLYGKEYRCEVSVVE